MIRFFLFLSLFLTSCGYHWEPREPLLIEMPFVQSDPEGSLTAAIAKALTSSGLVVLRSESQANYQLKLKLKNPSLDTIGYQHRRNKKNGKPQKSIIASESRYRLCLIGKLICLADEKCVLGPFEIEAEGDFDFLDGDSLQDLVFIDPKGDQQTVLPYSLGQLEPKENAQEAAIKAVYQKLADRLANYLRFALTR